jgi:hypothetical protein
LIRSDCQLMWLSIIILPINKVVVNIFKGENRCEP